MAKRAAKRGKGKKSKKSKAGSGKNRGAEKDVGIQDFKAKDRLDTVARDIQDLHSQATKKDAWAAKLDAEAEQKRMEAQTEREHAACLRQEVIEKEKDHEKAKLDYEKHVQWLRHGRKPPTNYYFGGKKLHEDNFPVSVFLSFSSPQDIGRVSQTHRVLRNCHKETIVRRIVGAREYTKSNLKYPAVLLEHENPLKVLRKLDRLNLIYCNLGPQRYKQVVGYRSHIAGGSGFSLFLNNRGAISSCGVNGSGQLGLGYNGDEIHLPVAIPSLSRYPIVSVAAGYAHAVAITDAGEVLTWGDGGDGRLGHGVVSIEPHPRVITSIQDTHRIVGVACGSYHTLLLNDLGQVLSCGYNFSGQLGLGHTSNQLTPCLVEALDGQYVVQVTAGSQSSGALTYQNKCFTWGNGRGYRLGHGTTYYQPKPKLVEGLIKYTITHLALGGLHGLALDVKGNVFSWGLGYNGQLGHGNTEDQQLPKQIEYLKESKCKIKKIHCRHYQSVLVETSGKVLTFGDGEYGRLGHGDIGNHNIPTVISSLEHTKISEAHFGEKHLLLLSKSDDGGKLFSCGGGIDWDEDDDYEEVEEVTSWGLGHDTDDWQLVPEVITSLLPHENEFSFVEWNGL